ACHAETCFSSVRLTSVSNRTSPALAIGSEIRRSLLRIADWIERADSDDPALSLLIDATRRLVASTSRHCQGVSWAVAAMKASTSAVCGPKRCEASSLALWMRPSRPCEAGATPLFSWVGRRAYPV